VLWVPSIASCEQVFSVDSSLLELRPYAIKSQGPKRPPEYGQIRYHIAA
jgi:hypothetical protein